MLNNLLAKEKVLLSNCMVSWKKTIMRRIRNRLTVENFKKGACAKLAYKTLFALQRHLRSMVRKNFLKLEQQKTLLEENLEKVQGTMEELGGQNKCVVESQNNTKKIIAELNEKIELLEHGNVNLRIVIVYQCL